MATPEIHAYVSVSLAEFLDGITDWTDEQLVDLAKEILQMVVSPEAHEKDLRRFLRDALGYKER